MRGVVNAGTQVLRTVFHQLEPRGVRGVIVLPESHMSIHTWPETGYAAVDFYTCGSFDPQAAHPHLAEALGAQSADLILVHRGQDDRKMRVEHKRFDVSATPFRSAGPTLLPAPSQYFLVSGSAEGPTELNAFDHALLAAGVGDTNLVRLSSILPPHVERVEPKPLPPGALLPIAYSAMTSSEPGITIAATVAIALPVDENLPGLIMEHHGADTLERVSATVRSMAIAGMEHRGRAIRDVIVEGAEHTVTHVGTAFAGVVLWH